MSTFPIDLDSETIQFEGTWYTRDDLARRIKAMLDKGDFAISKQSAALEQLTSTLASVKPVTIKLSNEMIEALNQVAARHEKTVGALIREAVAAALAGSVTQAAPPPPPPAARVAGPGAPKNAEVEPAPVALTQPKKKEEEPAERRWFGG